MEFRGPRNRQINKEPQHKINELIKAPTVRVVGENIEAGVYPLREALAMAEAAGADLVEFLRMRIRPYAGLSNTVSIYTS